MRFGLLFLIFLFGVNTTFANVIINEVAWMGTVNSANDEWIELYNNGNEDVDLNGWILKAQDDTPLINLSGIIKTKSFFLLERTDDTTVPDISADLVYTGALSNTGEILILKNNDTEIDRIDASAGWPAGDNATKQTMQRTPDNKWITADPTPKAQNSGSQSTSTSTSGVDASQQTTTVVVWPVEPQIYANAGQDKTAVAGADIKFSGQALGLQKEPLENARYLWSFGDGAGAEGQNILHTYHYPGEYIVVLNVSSGKYSASDRLLVKVLENNLKIIEANENYIKLHNGSKFDLDISNWFLRANSKLFKFPESTLIKSGADLSISFSISGISVNNNQTVELLYPNASIAYSYSPTSNIEHPVSNIAVAEPKPTTVVDSSTKVKENPAYADVGNSVSDNEENTQQVASAISVGQNNSWSLKKWLAIILGIGIIASIGFFLIRRQSSV